MSSSADRRRPRVAGQRRRHGRPSVAGESETTAQVPAPDVVDDGAGGSGPDAPADTLREAPEQPVAAAIAVEPRKGPDDTVPDVPADTADADPEDAGNETAPGAAGAATGPTTTLRDLRTPLVVLVLALVAFALVAAVGLRDHGARERDARAATGAATAALEQLLSYDYRTIDEQADANAALLTGEFKGEYAQTMEKTIAPVAEKEKAVVQARSYEAGVMGQTPDTVTVEVFLNQAKQAADDEQPSVDQNRVIATMRRVGDRWLVEQLSAF